MKRYTNSAEKRAYEMIQKAVVESYGGGNINDFIDEDELFECMNAMTIEKQYQTVIDAVFNTIGFSGKGKQSAELNESMIRRGRELNLYGYINESVKDARKKKKKVDNVVDEGLLGGLVGALAGVTVGTAIGKAVAEALGIKQGGVLWDLMTSKLVNASICSKLGLRM